MGLTSQRFEGKISPEIHVLEIDECLQILRELKRTIETDGRYCPYNWTFPYQAKVVHELLAFLTKKILRA